MQLSKRGERVLCSYPHPESIGFKTFDAIRCFPRIRAPQYLPSILFPHIYFVESEKEVVGYVKAVHSRNAIWFGHFQIVYDFIYGGQILFLLA